MATGLHERPIYRRADVARFVRVPPSTVTAWVCGRPYDTALGQKRFEPLLVSDDEGSGNLLSVTNVVELQVLAAMRRYHDIPLSKVRAALSFVEDRLSVSRPLVHQSFLTDGLSLFVENFGDLMDVSASGQVVIRELVGNVLRRVGRDDAGHAIRLYLFRDQVADEPQHVLVDPRFSFGEPVVDEIFVPTAVIMERYEGGDSEQLLAADYGCSEARIREAIVWEDVRRTKRRAA